MPCYRRWWSVLFLFSLLFVFFLWLNQFLSDVFSAFNVCCQQSVSFKWHRPEFVLSFNQRSKQKKEKKSWITNVVECPDSIVCVFFKHCVQFYVTNTHHTTPYIYSDVHHQLHMKIYCMYKLCSSFISLAVISRRKFRFHCTAVVLLWFWNRFDSSLNFFLFSSFYCPGHLRSSLFNLFLIFEFHLIVKSVQNNNNN